MVPSVVAARIGRMHLEFPFQKAAEAPRFDVAVNHPCSQLSTHLEDAKGCTASSPTWKRTAQPFYEILKASLAFAYAVGLRIVMPNIGF